MGHIAAPHARHVPGGGGQGVRGGAGGRDAERQERSLGVVVEPLARGTGTLHVAVAAHLAAEQRVGGQRQVQRVQQTGQGLAVTIQVQGLRLPRKQGGHVRGDVERKHGHRHHSLVVFAELHSAFVHPCVFGPQILATVRVD